ncbi:hypothetical protein ACQ4LE_004621 [Meloidogyne hapla]
MFSKLTDSHSKNFKDYPECYIIFIRARHRAGPCTGFFGILSQNPEVFAVFGVYRVSGFSGLSPENPALKKILNSNPETGPRNLKFPGSNIHIHSIARSILMRIHTRSNVSYLIPIINEPINYGIRTKKLMGKKLKEYVTTTLTSSKIFYVFGGEICKKMFEELKVGFIYG